MPPITGSPSITSKPSAGIAAEVYGVPASRIAVVPEPSDLAEWRRRFAAVPAGVYQATLALPAAEPSIADDPRFAIQTANVGTWDAASGRNDLQQTIELAAPAAPGKPRIKASGSDVRVSFTSPSAVGSSPLTGYRVTLTSASGQTRTLEVAATASQATFTDVPSGRWRATVTAVNGQGDGHASPRSATAVVHPGHHTHGE